MQFCICILLYKIMYKLTTPMKYNVDVLIRNNRKLDSRYRCSAFTHQFLCSTAFLQVNLKVVDYSYTNVQG